eukprot:TRINITY_DN36821_c1_g1_i1.p3 TRINITY_DN36821_c1_g1~~TRINITY_DN36821_c1_g1_i1.p3  ORF type:complete len:110 (-),score=5.74 TRINITY_DN36821_c1_g1_i1:105-434(-)
MPPWKQRFFENFICLGTMYNNLLFYLFTYYSKQAVQAVQSAQAMDVEQRGSTPQFQRQDMSARLSRLIPPLLVQARSHLSNRNSLRIGSSEFRVCPRIDFAEFLILGFK